MKKLPLIFSALLLVTSCTENQQDRIHEWVASKPNTWNKARAANTVKEARKFPPTDEFALQLETGRTLATEKGTYPLFFLKGETLPLQETLILAEIDEVDNKIDPLYEFTILETGELKLTHSSLLKHELIFSKIDNIKYGRPLKFVICSLETGQWAEATFHPLPLETKTETGKELSLFATHPRSTRFELRGTGFAPHENITLNHKSQTLDETIYLLANENGAFTTELIPVEYGLLGGDATITLASGPETLTLSYPWGSRLEQRSIEQNRLTPICFIYNLPEDLIDHNALESAVISTLFN